MQQTTIINKADCTVNLFSLHKCLHFLCYTRHWTKTPAFCNVNGFIKYSLIGHCVLEINSYVLIGCIAMLQKHIVNSYIWRFQDRKHQICFAGVILMEKTDPKPAVMGSFYL